MDFQKIRPCVFCGKEKEIKAKGLCAACYQRQLKRGTPEYIKVKKPCVIAGCDKLAEAHGLCATHLKRWQRHEHTKQTRPNGWGSKGKHPLYNAWCWRKRKTTTAQMCPEWIDNFWVFVNDVGDRPSKKHILQRIDKGQPYSKENFEWFEKRIVKNNCETQKEYARRYAREYRKTPQGMIALKNHDLKKNSGITLEDYEKIYKAQNGVCVICGKEESNRYDLAVDHDHKTGKIRGLLCRSCNTGLGLFQDSTELLAKAIEYLQ